jgi:hypothetical protein
MDVKPSTINIMKLLYSAIIGLFFSYSAFSQNDIPLVDNLGDEDHEVVDKTFPAIRIYNLPTTDVLAKGEMKLYLAHRMGQIGTGFDGLYGLYTANSRIGSDLGLLKSITIGIGSTSQQKLFDGYFKVLLLRQRKGASPVSVGMFSDATISFAEKSYPETQTWQKMSYTSELMISRLFSERISAQWMFGVVHKNMVVSAKDKNTIWATGLAADFKTGRKIHLAFEYVFLPRHQVHSVKTTRHIISAGIQIHSGPRHVFQIFLSNSTGINEMNVVSETTDHFSFKTIRICFNIPTTFKIFN